MSSAVSPSDNVAEYPSSSHINHHRTDSELRAAITNAYSALDQTPPPSVREILGAYKSKGDGDRDMLLAILSAKNAEEQRIASATALHRAILEVTHTLPESSQIPPRINESHHNRHHPPFTLSPVQPARHVHHHHISPHSHSPGHTHTPLSSVREAGPPNSQPPRKRQRSHSPPTSHIVAHESHSGSQHEQLPPSPYSSSGSDSAEYSPRSRTSMAIGSLLSSGTNKASNGDETQMNGHMSSDRSRGHQNHLQP